MIANIIEESYHNKYKPKKPINIHYEGPKEPFHQMEEEKLNVSINYKVKRTEKKINEGIDELLVFSLVENDDKDPNSQKAKFRKIKTPVIQVLKKREKQSKYLFKGDMSIAEKINKTKIKEFSFANTAKNKFRVLKKIKFPMQTGKKLSNKEKIKNMLLNPFYSVTTKSTLNPMKYYNISNSDCFFITKLPNYIKSRGLRSKENKLKKMRKIIKETNIHMLDIYNGLKNMKQNKISAYDNPLIYDNTMKYKKGFKNADKLNLGMQKSQSISYINRRFRKLFQNIFDNKKFSNEKMDARALLDPLEKISTGSYKEVKLDNVVNNKIGQRIWIKKSTANIVSYGKSFQLISDDHFFKERKRIIGIYPKIEKEAKLLIPRRKIEWRNPLINKIIKNVNKINNAFLNEHELVNRIKRKYT